MRLTLPCAITDPAPRLRPAAGRRTCSAGSILAFRRVVPGCDDVTGDTGRAPASSPAERRSMFPVSERAARVRFRRALSLMAMTLVARGPRSWSPATAGSAGSPCGSGSACSGSSRSPCSRRRAPRPGLLAGLQHLPAAGAAPGADGGRDRLGVPVHRRLAARPAADAGLGHRRAVVSVNGLLCLTVAGTLLFGAHLAGVQRDLIVTLSGDGEGHRRPRRPLQRAADGRRLRGGPLGPAARLDDRRLDRRRDRTHRADQPAAQHGELPVPRGHGHGPAVPRRVRLRGLLPQRGQHLGRRPHRPVPESDNPGVDATIMAIEGITGLRINYWAMVNLQGFKSLVDAVGGVELNVRDRIPVGGLGSDVTATSSPAPQHSTASRRSGTPGPGKAPTTTPGWRGRSA